MLAFEGATKRNKPDLRRGSLVFARVAAVPGVLEPELSCVPRDAVGRKDWMTGECIFGELRGGAFLRCGTALARHLLLPDCPVLLRLAKQLPFECAVGANGAVWVRAGSARETGLVLNAIRASERLNEDEVAAMVTDMVRAARAAGDD
uniref:K Homology domain-containing protein n=2 Tax=Phaeomonas parva TaxID=124430 RepID=A0A7S1TNS8_9STRA|mmetsp:Transcript_10970/g.33410  ORF Transcript_10970/g.33410 Transcript_10970/m.33410 type:complete len:148 (+) Transcript_10970:93-536(+)